ncbi:hypothetical protein D3C83_07780 [compost metagenome]
MSGYSTKRMRNAQIRAKPIRALAGMRGPLITIAAVCAMAVRDQSAGIASVLPVAQASVTGVPAGSCSWCHGSPTSVLKLTPPPRSTS